MSRSNPQRREPITDREQKCPFKKYADYTIGQIIEDDPGFLVWCHNNVEWFELGDELLSEAEGYTKDTTERSFDRAIS